MSKETVSVRLESEQKEALDALAGRLNTKRSDLIEDAIRAYLEVQEWQIKEIEKGIAEADAGLFATDDEVEAVFGKWTDERES